MLKKIIMVAIGACALCVLGGCSQSQDAKKSTPSASETWDIVADAYTFTLPLMMMDATSAFSTNTVEATSEKAPTNQLYHAAHLADSTSKMVVTPNVDTIYSQCWMNLSEEPLVFHKPAADRFLSVEILDYYTNSVAILGTGGDTQEARTYLITGPGWEGVVPDGLVQVEIPTNGAWLLVRTLIDGQDDMANVQALQEQMQVALLSDYAQTGFMHEAPKGSYSSDYDYVPVEHVLSMDPQSYFSRANELMVDNPPTAADAAMVERMATIGVGPGLTFDFESLGADGKEQWVKMLEGMRTQLEDESLPFMKSLGIWHFFGEPIAEFGTAYAYRASVALEGFGANPVSVAIYPRAEQDENGAVLNGENSYRVHFEKDQLPPVGQYGFWSITAYGDDDFLIDNELDRYCINDRSGVVLNEDGSLDLYVQAEAPKDEALRANWLPIGEGGFHLYLRIYIPSDMILQGAWQPPTVNKV